MTLNICPWLVAGTLAFALGASAAGERRVVIADFADPAVGRTAWVNPWGGEKRGKAEFDERAGCVRYSFPASNGSAGARIVDRLVRERLTNETGRLTHFYVRYRTDDPKANPSLNQQTTADTYVSVTGFVPDGSIREARIRPAGWSRKSLPFDRNALTSLYFAASDATFEIHEIGAILDPTPVPPLEPAVDTEAFRLYPEPQVFLPGEATFPLAAYAAPQAFGARAETAATWFSARIARFYPELRPDAGRRPVIFALAGTAAGRSALRRLKLANNFGRVKFDGYAFGVRADGIDVVAHNETGLMNGVRSLMQTIHQASGDAGPAQVRALTVVDWPRVEHRMLYIPVYNCALKGLRQEPADYAGLLDRFVFGARYNLVSFDLGTMYAWGCDPTYRPGETGWTPADLTNLVDRVNALGGRVVPFVMSPGHMRPALFWYGGHSELMEEGAKEALCLGHPRTYETLFARMQEMADVCAHNPGWQAPVFYTGGDEVRWKHGLPYEARCPYCRDTPRSEQLLAHMRKVDAWCRERNYQMLMCSDMYVPAHNGFGPARGALVADRLEKTIALLHWGNMDWDEMELWHRRGHRNWKVMTGYSSDPAGDAYCDGYGFALYTGRWWLTRQRGGGKALNYTPANVFIVGAQGWGPAPATDDEGWRRAQAWGNFWMRNWSRKPIPSGSARFAPVSLRAAANGSVASAHAFATPALSGVPVAFAPPPGEGRVGCVRADGAEHVVAVARKAASLVFLHTGSAAGAMAKGVAVEDGFDQMYGLPVATWRVAYADGGVETFTVRYGWNVGSRETSARGDNYERYLGDARYAWADADGVTVYAHEWVNPHPEREIASLTLAAKPTAVDYELWALTARLPCKCYHTVIGKTKGPRLK